MSLIDSIPTQGRRKYLIAITAAGVSAFGIRHFASLRFERRTDEVNRREQEAAARHAAAEAEAQRLRHEREELERRLRGMIRHQAGQELESARSEDAKAITACIADLEHEFSAIHERAGRFIPGIANQMGSIQGVFWSILLMARDQLTGSIEMQQLLDTALAPLTTELAAMRAAGDAALGRLAHCFDANSNRAANRLASAVKQVREEHQAALPEFTGALEPVIQAINAGSVKLGLAVSVLPLEIGGVFGATALLKSLRTQIEKWLRGRLEKWVQRAAATGSANIALVAADGPLPIGDALALLLDIGFTTWALWEVHHLSKQVPADIASQLQSGLNTYRHDVLTALKAEANRLQREARGARLVAFNSLLGR